MPNKPTNSPDKPIDLDTLDFEAAFDSLVDVDDRRNDPAPMDLTVDPVATPDDEKVDEDESTETTDVADEETTDESEDTAAEDSKETDEVTEDDADDDTEEQTLSAELAQRLGIETDSDFEDSVDGLVDMTREAAVQIAEQQLGTLFNELPDVQQFMQYRLEGGDPSQYFETMFPRDDYEKLDIGEDDTSLQERIVRKAFQVMGRDDEDITDTLSEFKSSGILHSQAQKALKSLTKHQATQKAKLLEDQATASKQAATDAAAYVKEVKETIASSTDFRGIIVSEKEKDEFTKYVSDPIAGEGGKSQFHIDMETAPTDVLLAIAALLRKDFNLDGIVSRRAKSLKAQELRDRLTKQRNDARNRGDDRGEEFVPANVAKLDLIL